MKKRAKMKRLAIMNVYLRNIRARGLRIQVTFHYWRNPEPAAGPQAVWKTTWSGADSMHESCMDTTETVAFLRGADWAAANAKQRLADDPIRQRPKVVDAKDALMDPARPELGRRVQVLRELPMSAIPTMTAAECRRVMVHSHPYRKDISTFKSAVYAHLTQLREEAAAK